MPLKVIPNDLETLNQSERYVLNKLKELYKDEEEKAYLYLEPKIKNLNPDFILIDMTRGVSVIEVKAWSIDYIDTINNKEVIATDKKSFHNPSYRTRQYYNTTKSLFMMNENLLDEMGELSFSLSAILIFTMLKKSEVQEHKISQFLSHYPTQILYKEEMRKITFEMLFSLNKKFSKIDEKFFTLMRTVIFPEIKIASSKIDSELVDIKALDIEQEEFARRLPNGHYHISGVPGSGKTVILIARAIHLQKMNPSWRVGIMTYNKALASKIQNRLNILSEELKFMEIDVSNIEVVNFHKFALSLANTKVVNEEIFWRETLPTKALENAYPQFDALCIDEYQDFYDIWLKVCISSIIKHNDNVNLLLAGDRLQSIYNPNEINWKKNIGLSMSGRSKLLKHSYRSSSEHITLGLSLLLEDEKYKKEVEKFYDGVENIKGNTSLESVLYIDGTYNDVAKVLEKTVNELETTDILVLGLDWKRMNSFKSSLPISLQNKVVVGKEIIEGQITITTYHSSKGLEARVVILLDMDSTSDIKLKYVAITRASEKLIIHR